MKFLVSTAYSLLLLIVSKNSGAQDIQGTISPSNLVIDEAPYAAILGELLANLSSVSLRNALPERRMVQQSFISSECYPAVTVNFTCSYPNATSITAALLWVKRDGSDQFERDFRFSRTVLSSSSDNFTVEFQRTLQLREIGEFTELAGLYMCQADTGAETANATVNVLYRPIFDHGVIDGPGEVVLSRDFSYYLLTTMFVVEEVDDNVTLPLAFVGANPPPGSFLWMLNDEPLLSLDGSGDGSGGDGGRFVGTGNGVMLHSPHRRDSGVYTVTATNGGGTGRLSALLVVRFPPEFTTPERVLYVRVGDPLQLNCTPDAHSSSGENVPSYDLEDGNGPTSITRLSYKLSKNGTEIMTSDFGSSGVLNVTDAADMTDGGMYRCVVEDAVFDKRAIISTLARRKRGIVGVASYEIFESVALSLLGSPVLSSTADVSVVVGDVPMAPRALIVAVTSPSSVTVSWVPGPSRQTGSLVPAVLHEVTLSELETGLVIRRINVSNTDRLGRQRQVFDSLTAGSYQVAISAGNIFGRSRRLSLNFDITERNCFYLYALIVSATVLLAALLLVSALVAGLMCAIRHARRSNTPQSGDSPGVGKSQNTKDNGAHTHLSGHAPEGTHEDHIGSTSLPRLGSEEGGVDLQSGERLLLETNPAYQSGAFIAETDANNAGTQEPSSASSTVVCGSGCGGNEIGAPLVVFQEPTLGAPSPNVGAPPPNIEAPPPNVGAPSPNTEAPLPNVDAPSLFVGVPTPNNEAGMRVYGTNENTTDQCTNDIYDVVV